MAVINFRTKGILVDLTDDPNDPIEEDVVQIAAAGLPANGTLRVTATIGAQSAFVEYTADGNGEIPWTSRVINNVTLAARIRRFPYFIIRPQSPPAVMGPVDGLTLTFELV